jgi:F-type H+-transporting ATPase subunit b
MSLAIVIDATSLNAGGAVDVDFDLTVVGQIVLFLVLMAILKPILFDPMLKLFEEREKRIDGAKLQARKTDEASAGALAKYENALLDARNTANAEREKLRAEGLKTENEILAKVRAATASTLEAGRKHTEADVRQVRGTLPGTANQLALDIAGRVLGREVQG